ncbi:unnamed protein product, partial [Sphacelaria rigidula]
DEDSQAILSLLQCTNSRVGLGLNSNTMSMDGSTAPSNTTMSDSARVGPTGGGGGGGGGVAAAAAGSKRRGGRDDYSGELDAREVANGFGMGMSSKPLKRTKSEGSNPKDVTTAEARARMDRAFTMPQFVTSVKGFGGSGRAKQAQRKGSFLSRAGSLQARSGSLASGKTTVSASKFVFMSSSTTSMGGEDTSARTGFEEPAASDGSGGGGYGGGDKRPDISASGSNMSGSGGMSKGGVFSGIAGARKGAGGVAGAGAGRAGASRLWKGLRAESKSKSKSKR